MKDIPRPHLLSKFQSKSCKSLVTLTCPIFLCCHRMHIGPLEVMDGCTNKECSYRFNNQIIFGDYLGHRSVTFCLGDFHKKTKKTHLLQGADWSH